MISSDARKMMLKALGLNGSNREVRHNRYFLTKKSRAWIIWAGLVKKGYAIHEPARDGGFDFFAVTGKGFDAIRGYGDSASIGEDAIMRLHNKHPSVGTDITDKETIA